MKCHSLINKNVIVCKLLGYKRNKTLGGLLMWENK